MLPLFLCPVMVGALQYAVPKQKLQDVSFSEVDLVFEAAIKEIGSETEAEQVLAFLKEADPQKKFLWVFDKPSQSLARVICQGTGFVELLTGYYEFFENPLCQDYAADSWTSGFILEYARVYGTQMTFSQRKILYSLHLTEDIGWMHWIAEFDPQAVWTEWWHPRLQMMDMAKGVLQIAALNGFSLFQPRYGPEWLINRLQNCLEDPLSLDLLRDSLIPTLLPEYEPTVYQQWQIEHGRKFKSMSKPMISVIASPLPIAELMKVFAPHLALLASTLHGQKAHWLQLLIPTAPSDMALPETRYLEILEWIMTAECDADIIEVIWNNLVSYMGFASLATSLLSRQSEEKLAHLLNLTRPCNFDSMARAALSISLSDNFKEKVLWPHAWKMTDLWGITSPLPLIIEKIVGESEEFEPGAEIRLLSFQDALLLALNSDSAHKEKLFAFAEPKYKLKYAEMVTDPSELVWILPSLPDFISELRLQPALSHLLRQEHLPPKRTDLNLQWLHLAKRHARDEDWPRLTLIFGQLLLEYLEAGWKPITLRGHLRWLETMPVPIPPNPLWEQVEAQLGKRLASASSSYRSTIMCPWSEFKAKILMK